MKSKAIIAVLGLIPLGGCSATANRNSPESSAETITQSDAFHECIRTAMTLTLGDWRYTAVIARLNGAFRVYETQSIHEKADEDTWTSRSFGGDVEEETTSSTRLVGDKWIPIENGILMTDQALTFHACEGPNTLGWYQTQSTYQLPPDSEDAEPYFVRASSTYGAKGSYFTEDITTADGTVVARRSGVTTPAK